MMVISVSEWWGANYFSLCMQVPWYVGALKAHLIQSGRLCRWLVVSMRRPDVLRSRDAGGIALFRKEICGAADAAPKA
jgi:hypothetical protein